MSFYSASMCICCAALPQPPADFFNLGVVATSTPSSSSDSQTPQAGGAPPPASAAGPGFAMPPMPMFRPPIGMIPPHLPMGPGGPRRPPPPPPRIGGPPPGRPFPPGVYYCCFTFCSRHLIIYLLVIFSRNYYFAGDNSKDIAKHLAAWI